VQLFATWEAAMRLSIQLVMHLLLTACGVSIADGQVAMQSGPSALPSSPTTDVVRTPVRSDKNHPLTVASEAYPAESLWRGEKGHCVVRIQVDPDGVMRAEQLLFSTGYPRLDEACLKSFIEKKLIPATADRKPVAAWITAPLNWGVRVTGENDKHDYSKTPQFDNNYRLEVGPDYYPSLSRQMHQEGTCLIKVHVSEDGIPSDLDLLVSTGYSTLDQACVAAIQHAKFVPGKQGGKGVSAWTAIFISWRLPSN
jgi:TonB family protein